MASTPALFACSKAWTASVPPLASNTCVDPPLASTHSTTPAWRRSTGSRPGASEMMPTALPLRADRSAPADSAGAASSAATVSSVAASSVVASSATAVVSAVALSVLSLSSPQAARAPAVARTTASATALLFILFTVPPFGIRCGVCWVVAAFAAFFPQSSVA